MKISNLLHVLLSKRFYNGKIKNIIIRKPILVSKGINYGNKIFVRDGSRLELVHNNRFQPNFLIEDNVNIEQHCHITCGEELFIGKNTAVLANVCITDIVHPYSDIHISPKYQEYKTFKTHIGEDCIIGMNSVILAGTKLGKHTIVGANSVVSGEFPDYCVIVGSPARIVKRFDFETNTWMKVKEAV